MTLSLSVTVGTLWAMVITVQLENCCLMTFWRIASVAESMDAVASSRTRILFLRRRTLPRQKSWRCPTLQLSPSSLTSTVHKNEPDLLGLFYKTYIGFLVNSQLCLPIVSRRAGVLLIAVFSWHFFKAWNFSLWVLFCQNTWNTHCSNRHVDRISKER